MEAVKHGWKPPGKHPISQSKATEWANADEARGTKSLPQRVTKK
jgi:hypothetical protein